jgi:hypothetical protein
MAQSITKGRTRKAAKPHADFPLFTHQTGRWAQKMKGRFVEEPARPVASRI